MTDPHRRSDRVLCYAPVPLFRHGGTLHVEDQALIGLRSWGDNFAHADILMPIADAAPPQGYTAIGPGTLPGNVTLHDLPMAYRPDQFARALRPTVARLRALIAAADYRTFAIGGLFGDWGAVSALTAHRMGLPFAVWTDRVESEVVRQGAAEGPWRTRLRKRLYHRPMALLERAVIRRATVGLFHGRETFDHYAPFARKAEVMHDIMIDRTDHLTADGLARKQADAANAPLRIAYAGRADPMKGPMDWIGILARLKARGVAFHATWLGDGPDHAAMQDAVRAQGLEGAVSLPGFTADRGAVMQTLRDAHVFLFCHRTPESPRCLIEALVSGTPLVGYDGAYARDLLGTRSAGLLRPIDDLDGLAAALAGLDADRGALSAHIAAARQAGDGFDAETVFRHRAEMLRAHLGPPNAAA